MNDPLPADAIQRVLFICSKVHVYSIPPLTSNKGYVAASWTENNNAREIFVARIRLIETSVPPPASDPTAQEKISVNVLLEDPKTGELFAAAPYQSKTVVEAAVDSSRFYAIRVVGDGGQKATLGIGFEDRSESIDFGISLQECRKVLGLESGAQAVGGEKKGAGKGDSQVKKDWSLKEGETIKIDIGKKGSRLQTAASQSKEDENSAAHSALFSIKPPPPASSADSIPMIAPPPTAPQRSEKRRSRRLSPAKPAKDPENGFDDEYVFPY